MPSYSSAPRRSTNTPATPISLSPSTRPTLTSPSPRPSWPTLRCSATCSLATDSRRASTPGSWLSPDGIHIDIMVPEALAGPGTRGARLGPHGKRAARRAKGLEGALVDRDRHSIAALDPSDNRQISMWVAGPGALLVAKVHKIAERVDASDRVRDKDALDVLRLLRAIDTDGLAARLRSLVAHDVAGPVTTEAVGLVRQLFGTEQSDGVVMAVRAAGTSEDAAMITGSMVALATDVTSALG